MDELQAFLEGCRVKKGEAKTHTTKSTGDLPNGWRSGSYYIPSGHIDRFFTFYNNAIRSKNKCTVTEIPSVIGPLRVDFDFVAPIEVGTKRQYSTDTLKSIVGSFQTILKSIIDPDDFEKKMLYCLVLEKPAPRSENGSIKDGFHLHFPHFICEGWIQDKYIRDEAVKKIIESGTWKGRFTTRVEEIIDKDIGPKPWMMYGSMNYKTKKSTPYLYNRWETVPEAKRYGHGFNDLTEEMDLDEMFCEQMIGKKNTVRYYLPTFLSIRGYKKPTLIINEVQSKKNALLGIKKKKRVREIQKTRVMADILKDIKTIKDGNIMEMISEDRAASRDDWMDLGWTLFNIGQGCNDALELWIDFSKKNSKFVEGECEELWSGMELRDKTIASLLAMAKSDSPDLYNEWKNTHVTGCVWRSLAEAKPNEYDVAMVVDRMYSDRFICADGKRDIWYEFYEHRWRYMDDGIALKRLLVTEVVEKYCNLRRDIHNDIGDLEHRYGLEERDSDRAKELKVELERKIAAKKRCTSIITALKTCTFHDKVIKMCKLAMYDPDFSKKLDENRNLLCCENGVIDLDLGIFRDGRPDDCMTFSTGIYYRSFREDDEDVIELDNYLEKVYTNKKLRDYFLDFMASCMQGGNVNKRFLIATGPSDGAKSMTFALISLAFGEGETGYFGKFPRELIVQATGRNSSSGARPELSRVRGKRVMGCQEITKEEKVNIGFIKESTGNDSFYSRGLYEKGTEVKPQFTLMMQCLAEGTFVSLPSGISVPIEQLVENKEVLSYFKNSQHIQFANQTRFLDQGVKECVKITMEDGEEVVCTPNHRFLCKSPFFNEDWVEVQDMIPGETCILSTIPFPRYTDIFNLNIKYILEGYDLSTVNGRSKVMALSRLVGRRISAKERFGYDVIYACNSHDIFDIETDVILLYGDQDSCPTFTKRLGQGSFVLHIPESVVSQIDDFHKLTDKILTDRSTPLFIVREILGAMIGGYEFVYFEKEYRRPEEIGTRNEIESMVFDRFGIDCCIPHSDVLDIAVYGRDNYLALIEKIGVRYSVENSNYHATIAQRVELDVDNRYTVDLNRDYPVYQNRIINIQNVGKRKVYDITVDKVSNFIANNLISHNCNEPPDVPGQDEATWSRIRVLDHSSKFVKPQDLAKWPVPASHKEQMEMKRFKADPTFKSKLPDLAPVLLWRIFQRFKIYKERGLKEPKEVMVATDQYQTRNDIYTQFIQAKIEKVGDPAEAKKSFVKLSEAFSEFKDWYTENYPSYSKDKIGKNTLKHELTKRLGLIRNADTDLYGFGTQSRWWGYRILLDDDADEEFGKNLLNS